MHLFDLKVGRLRYISQGLIAFVGLILINNLFPNAVTLDIYTFWEVPNNWTFLKESIWFLLYAFIMQCLLFRVYPARSSEKFSAGQSYIENTLKGVFAAITEEPFIRWALSLFIYACLVLIGTIFKLQINHVTLYGISIAITSIIFVSYHDGYRFHGYCAVLALSLFLFYILLVYGILAAIIVHGLYNFVLESTEYLLIKLN